MKRKPSTEIHLTTDPQRSEQIMVLKGKLLGTPECYEMLDEIRDRIQDGLTRVVIDMSSVDLINSAGAGILAAIVTSANRQGGRLILVGLQERCQRVLEFMHLHTFATFCSNMDEAHSSEA